MINRAENLLGGVGNVFIQLRQEAGLSQRESAKLAESTQARLSDIENGKTNLSVSTLAHWAEVYGHEVEISFYKIGSRDDETDSEGGVQTGEETEGGVDLLQSESGFDLPY